MSFLPDMKQARRIKPEGSTQAKIAIIGDYTSAFDDNALRPFQGAGGQILEQCLHLAGLIRGEVYLTNCIKSKPTKRLPPKSAGGPCAEYFHEGQAKFTPEGRLHLEDLQRELDACDANVLVACGKAASVGLCGVAALTAKRGYVFPSIGLKEQRKVIPTHQPSQALRGNFTYRHMITCDLKKAKIESQFRELRRPDRNLIYQFANIEEVLAWLEFYRGKSPLSVDIEVINFEVSCINLAHTPETACVIPIADSFANTWTEDEELFIWRRLAEILGDEKTEKVLQNSIFDIQFMLSKYGVKIRGPIRDTMIAHSCMFPELPKGLGFLGSIYCGAQEYWKDMVKFNDIKENS